jgi:hypothetical protein
VPALPPTAQIDSIVPDPVIQGFHPQVAFYGSGWDNDEGGQSIAAWRWMSSLNGQIGTSATCTRDPASLFVGTHTITLSVKDDEDVWSPADTSYLEVRAPDTSPPTWPNGTGVLDVEDLANGGSVRLFWNAAQDANPPIRYNVYHSASSPPFSGTCLADVEWTSGGDYACGFVVSGLPVDVPRYFGIRAADLIGNEDGNTEELSCTPTAGSVTYSYLPTDDAYVSDAEPDANFGNSTLLLVSAGQISYLRFTVPDLGDVASATLSVVAATSGDTATVWPVASTSWEEETVTWNTRPFLGGTSIGGISEQSPAQTYTVDLSSYVTVPGVYSVALNAPPTRGGAFYSKEHSAAAKRPYLVVAFLADTEPPAQVDGMTSTDTGLDVVLAWQVSTDNVGVAGYRVYRGATVHFNTLPHTLIGTTQNTYYTDIAVLGDPDADHFYAVTAFDAVGNESPPSNRVGEKEYPLTLPGR